MILPSPSIRAAVLLSVHLNAILSALLAVLSGSFLAGCTGDGPGTPPVEATPDFFTTSVDGLDPALPMSTVEAGDGDTVILTATPVKKVLRGKTVRMLAYNGSIPGPLLKVRQGSRITLRIRNLLGMPTTLHPHGIRLENRFDGTPDVQHEIAHGDSFDYALSFPDPGPFWYHPHLREAYALEMGLYGNILVAPADSAYWYPVDREIPLLLDDVLTDSAGIVPFRKDMADHAMNGRFGNVFLANGDTDLVIPVRFKEVVRLHLTNACNTRVLFVGIHEKDSTGHYLNRAVRAVGSDMGRFQEHDYPFYEMLAPGERFVVENYFYDTATVYLMHNIARPNGPQEFVKLATFKVLPETVETSYGAGFYRPDTSAAAIASIDSFRTDFARPPDRSLLLTARMNHVHLMKKAHDPNGKGVEWDDHVMPGMPNAGTTPENFTWVIRDPETGKENHDIDWTFKRGDRVKIRIHNDTGSIHAMPHPIHFHGQRFLVVRINGLPNPATELAWKDTYLVGRGETAEILLDASNPGRWMAHCHIAEHLEASMMFNYTVE